MPRKKSKEEGLKEFCEMYRIGKEELQFFEEIYRRETGFKTTIVVLSIVIIGLIGTIVGLLVTR